MTKFGFYSLCAGLFLGSVLGSKAFGYVKDISSDKEKRKVFLNSLAEQRRKEEKDRNDYFRFNDE